MPTDVRLWFLAPTAGPAVVWAESLPKSLAKLLAMFSFLEMKVTLSTPAVTMPAPVLVLNCCPLCMFTPLLLMLLELPEPDLRHETLEVTLHAVPGMS